MEVAMAQEVWDLEVVALTAQVTAAAAMVRLETMAVA